VTQDQVYNTELCTFLNSETDMDGDINMDTGWWSSVLILYCIYNIHPCQSNTSQQHFSHMGHARQRYT